MLALGAGYAWAAPANISGTALNHFDAPDYTQRAGDTSQLTHGAGGLHNVTANKNGPDGKPIFRSPTISSGSTPIAGTQYLPNGSVIIFHCTVHGSSMSATLHVTGGSPLARPSIGVSVRSKKINTVATSRKLKIKASSSSASGAPGAIFVAKLGSHTLTKALKATVGPHGFRSLKLRLTSSGKNLLKAKKAAGKKAKIKVIATVAFGRPDTAKKTLK